MALTQAEKTELLNAIKAESQSVDELAQVTSLDGIVSLPAIRGTEVVSAPVSLLRKPAEDAAKTANAAAAAANTSATSANAAAQKASDEASYAHKEAEKAHSATENAIDATNKLQAAIDAARRHPVVLVNEILGDPDRTFAGWSEAKDALAGYADSDGEEYMSTGCILIFKGPKRWESWQFIGIPDSEISDSTKWIPFTTGGNGSGFYNVTEQQPLTTGYYTKATAVAALANADIDDEQKRGMIITFESAPGKWEDYRFTGTSISMFLTEGAWEQYGADGVVKKITLNGTPITPDEQGNVNINTDQISVDESLDTDSTNPVQNKVVAGKVAELEAGTLFDSEVRENDDSTVTVQLKSKSAVITEFTLPAGGGGGVESATTKIVLGASVDKPTVKLGDSVKLTFAYDHQNAGGDEAGTSTGQKATIDIQVKRGAVQTYHETRQDVAKGSYEVDITKYLLLGSHDIYVVATTIDPNTGKQQRKQAYISVRTLTLALSSSYNISQGLSSGGFGTSDTIEIPYTVSGTGTKAVALYVDGKQRNLHSVTRSGIVNDHFALAMSGLNVGRHTVQMVATMEVDGLTLKSESIYFDILKRGASGSFIGIKTTHADGRILEGTAHGTPKITVGQYEKSDHSRIRQGSPFQFHEDRGHGAGVVL